MSVENLNVIDGMGLDADRAVMVISDHLEWGDPVHLSLLGAKIEAYANAALSGQLVESYPQAKDRPLAIKLVWQHEPDETAASFVETIRQQLDQVGIAFEHGPLPDDY
jgi:hypothetical protein